MKKVMLLVLVMVMVAPAQAQPWVLLYTLHLCNNCTENCSDEHIESHEGCAESSGGACINQLIGQTGNVLKDQRTASKCGSYSLAATKCPGGGYVQARLANDGQRGNVFVYFDANTQESVATVNVNNQGTKCGCNGGSGWWGTGCSFHSSAAGLDSCLDIP